MGGSKHELPIMDKPSHSVAKSCVPTTRLLGHVSQQELEEQDWIMQSASDSTFSDEEDVTSSEGDDEIVVVDKEMTEAVTDSAAASHATNVTRSGQPDCRTTSPGFCFDDNDMVDISDDDPDQEYYTVESDRKVLSTFDVLIGPYESEDYELHPQDNTHTSFLQSLPGMRTLQHAVSTSASAVTNGISNVTGGLMYTAQVAREAATVTRRVRESLADGAVGVGQDVVIRVQELWPGWPRGPNGGILGSLTEFFDKGVRSLPPSDTIIRPRGRQMHA